MVWSSYIVKIKKREKQTIKEKEVKKVYFVIYGVNFLSVKIREIVKYKPYLFQIYFFF